MRKTLAVLAILLLAGCAGGPKARYFPPTASVQEIRALPSGDWSMAILVQNTARLGIRVTSVKGSLQIDGAGAAAFDQTLDLFIAANGVERITVEVTPTDLTSAAVAAALESRRGVAYIIEGSVGTSEPGKRTDPFRFESRLNPAPGLPGTLR